MLHSYCTHYDSAYVILYLNNRQYILNIIALKNRPRLRGRFQVTSTKWKSFVPQSTLPHCRYVTLKYKCEENLAASLFAHSWNTNLFAILNSPNNFTAAKQTNTTDIKHSNIHIHPTLFFLVILNIKYIYIIPKNLFTILLTASLDGTTTVYMGFVPNMLYQYEPKWNSCSMGVRFIPVV